jgi:hypothetical protein
MGPPGLLIDTVIWQYYLNRAFGTGALVADLNPATQRGYDEMWGERF